MFVMLRHGCAEHPTKQETFSQCWFNADAMLARRLPRRSSIEPTLGLLGRYR